MKVAILSDIHENLHNMRIALNEVKSRNIKDMLFLGDYINPGLTKEFFEFCKNNGIKLKSIFGNNEGDKAKIMMFAMQNGVDQSPYFFAEYEFENKKVYITHYPEIAIPVSRSNMYDAVFYGHNHEYKVEKLDNGCLLANPGELSAHKTGRATYLIWDTEINGVETIEIDNPYNPNK
jgi:putative phosphoesterase